MFLRNRKPHYNNRQKRYLNTTSFNGSNAKAFLTPMAFPFFLTSYKKLFLCRLQRNIWWVDKIMFRSLLFLSGSLLFHRNILWVDKIMSGSLLFLNILWLDKITSSSLLFLRNIVWVDKITSASLLFRRNISWVDKTPGVFVVP